MKRLTHNTNKKNMETNEKVTSTTSNGNKQAFITSEEKAQYEVFRNGDLPKETIEQWITNDLMAVKSFVSGILEDKTIFNALTSAYYERYKKLHEGNEQKEAAHNG